MSKVSFWWGNSPLAKDIAGSIAQVVEKGIRPESSALGDFQCLTIELDADGQSILHHIQSILIGKYQIYPRIDIDNVDILDLVICQKALTQKLDAAIEQAIRDLLATRSFMFIKSGKIAGIRASLEKARNLPLFGYQKTRH